MDEIQNIFSMSKEKETKTAEETEAMTPEVETASTAKETTTGKQLQKKPQHNKKLRRNVEDTTVAAEESHQ